MPAAKQYYTAQDIKVILDSGLTQAYQIMHELEQSGRIFRKTKNGTMRVKIKHFDEYLQEHDGGYTYNQRLNAARL